MNSGEKIDTTIITKMLNEQPYMREMINACASCGMCADSCLYYKNSGHRKAVPSYKVRHTLGKLFKTKGNINRKELEKMADLLWGYCTLCRQCYCPMGIDLSSIIAFGRAICRSQNIDKTTECHEE